MGTLEEMHGWRIGGYLDFIYETMTALKSTFRLTHSNFHNPTRLLTIHSQMVVVRIFPCKDDSNLIAETLGPNSNVYLRKLWPSWIGYLIAETLGGEKSVGEEALGVVICQPPPPSL